MPKRFATPIQLPGDPTGALEAATKQYVDGRPLPPHQHSAGDITTGTLDPARLPRVLPVLQSFSVASGGTHTTDASLGSYVDLTVNGGNAIIALPTNGVNRQTVEYAIYALSATSVIFSSDILLTTGLSTRTFSVPAQRYGFFSLKYSTLRSNLQVWAMVAGTVTS